MEFNFAQFLSNVENLSTLEEMSNVENLTTVEKMSTVENLSTMTLKMLEIIFHSWQNDLKEL